MKLFNLLSGKHKTFAVWFALAGCAWSRPTLATPAKQNDDHLANTSTLQHTPNVGTGVSNDTGDFVVADSQSIGLPNGLTKDEEIASSKHANFHPTSLSLGRHGSTETNDRVSNGHGLAGDRGLWSDPDSAQTHGLEMGILRTSESDPYHEGRGALIGHAPRGTTRKLGFTSSRNHNYSFRSNRKLSDKDDWVIKGTQLDGFAEGDRFGTALAMTADGNTIVVGAEGHDGDGGTSSEKGHVVVYFWDGSSWSIKGTELEGYLSSDNAGVSVAISDDGNTIAVGAEGNDSEDFDDVGHVVVYYWNEASWIPKGEEIKGFSEEDYSGRSVSLSGDGNTVAVGVSGHDGSAGEDTGRVVVYYWDGVLWAQKGAAMEGSETGDEAGTSIALSADGNTVAFGAPYHNSERGHVMVYEFAGFGSSWTEKGLEIGDFASGDEAGYSIALSADGNTVAVGVPKDNLSDDGKAGAVLVYEFAGYESNWQQKGSAIKGLSSFAAEAGSAVAISSDGNIVAVGAPKHDGTEEDSGHVVIYEFAGYDSPWTQKGLTLEGIAVDDESGYSVALSADGSIVSIGSPGSGQSKGHVAVYYFNTVSSSVPSFEPSFESSLLPSVPPPDLSADWPIKGHEITGSGQNDQFGYAVAMSTDGDTIVVGAPYHDSSDESIIDGGRVLVYSWDGSSWAAKGSTFEGLVGSDNTGISVAISGDGDTIAFGKSTDDDQSGIFQIFYWDESGWVQKGQELEVDGYDYISPAAQSLALSSNGDTIAIQQGESGGGCDSGRVYVYSYDGTSDLWIQRGKYFDGSTTEMYTGWSLDFSADGNTLAIGSRRGDTDDKGFLEIYQWTDDSSSWTEKGIIKGATQNDEFSSSVALSADGDTIAVGATGHSRSTGQVLVYDWSGSAWEKKGEEIEGSTEGDKFGFSVAISDDGNTVAIGAPYSNDYTGQVAVYFWDGSTWTPIGLEVEDLSSSGIFGYSVAMSGDGNSIAVGAPGYDQSTGLVVVYDLDIEPSTQPSSYPSSSSSPSSQTSSSPSSQPTQEICPSCNLCGIQSSCSSFRNCFWDDSIQSCNEGACSQCGGCQNQLACSSFPDCYWNHAEHACAKTVCAVVQDCNAPSSEPSVSMIPSNGPTASSKPSISAMPSAAPSQEDCSDCASCEIQSACPYFKDCFWDRDSKACKSYECSDCESCEWQGSCGNFLNCYWDNDAGRCKDQSCDDCDSCQNQLMCPSFKNCFWDIDSKSCTTSVCDECDNCDLRGFCGDFRDCYWNPSSQSCSSHSCTDCEGCNLQNSCGAFTNCIWDTGSKSCTLVDAPSSQPSISSLPTTFNSPTHQTCSPNAGCRCSDEECQNIDGCLKTVFGCAVDCQDAAACKCESPISCAHHSQCKWENDLCQPVKLKKSKARKGLR